MSRIHEALKKAEQERAAIVTAESGNSAGAGGIRNGDGNSRASSKR